METTLVGRRCVVDLDCFLEPRLARRRLLDFVDVVYDLVVGVHDEVLDRESSDDDDMDIEAVDAFESERGRLMLPLLRRVLVCVDNCLLGDLFSD